MLVSKENIKSVIPQREPFVMVDNLLAVNDEVYTTNFVVNPNNIFLENECLQEYGLIENIAQSCAAGISYTKMNTAEQMGEGFIGSISKLTLHELPKVNDTLTTIITKKFEVGNMFLLHGKVLLNERLLIECELKLVGNSN
ncbi:MAG: hypothetical protein RI883_1478 [Bacteroidota bacterium]|jgi:predicted hotdog family 3-hydroxylacyl-ACP dehydratase